MTIRPRVFEKEEVESTLSALGVPESSISPTISFMRLVIPLAVAELGEDRLAKLLEDAFPEAPQSGWRSEMAKATEDWAKCVIERYRSQRFGKEDCN